MSYAEWQSWRATWSSHKVMHFLLYGIRRTQEEQLRRVRIRNRFEQAAKAPAADGGGAADLPGTAAAATAANDSSATAADLDVELELSQAEQEDLLLSPHCRTFFHPSHFHLYPLRLANVAGVVISFDDAPQVFDLRVGERFGSGGAEADGPTGAQQWEAFLLALLDPSFAKVCANAKTHLQILNALPMPNKVVQHVYSELNTTRMDAAGVAQGAAAGDLTDAPLRPTAPGSTSFLTLLYLSCRSRPLQIQDVRVAHWLYCPRQKDLLQLEAYYQHYVVQRAGGLAVGAAPAAATAVAEGARELGEAIKCSPDSRTNKGYDLQQVLARQRADLLRHSNPFAPADAPLPALNQPWQETSFDRFRFPSDVAGAASLLSLQPRLHATLLRHLHNSAMLGVYTQVETPVSAVLAHMEYYGMGFRPRFLQAHVELIKRRLRYLHAQARLFTVEDLDLDSPRAYVAELIRLQVPLPAWFQEQMKAKQGRGSFKDKPRLLAELAPLHPFAAILQELRKLSLSLSHFDTLALKAVPQPPRQAATMGPMRVHPTLLYSTETGRLACQDPNVQAISKQMSYRTAPLYSVAEEMEQQRLHVVAATQCASGRAEFNLRPSHDERRVANERKEARKKALLQIETAKRVSPQMKARLAQLRKPPPDTRLHVMALHPNGDLEHGQLIDVRDEPIGHGILRNPALAEGASAASAAVCTSAPWAAQFDPASPGAVSLAEWWRLGAATTDGASPPRWDVQAQCTVRVAVVQLHRGPSFGHPPFAFFPADQVWRSEAYVPWEIDQAAQAQVAAAAAAEAATTSEAVPMDESGDPFHPRVAASSVVATGSAADEAGSILDAPRVVSVAPRSSSKLHSFSVRDAFVAAPGYLLLSVDYSNIELRLMAHFAQDPTLLQLFHDRVDVLSAMASRLFKVPYDEVAPAQRATAKSCVYALLYGAGVAKVAEDNELDEARAKQFLTEFNRIFPSIQPALQRLIDQVARDGYITTLFDRRRPLKLLTGTQQQRAAERRKAPNTLCQGSAADLVKAAMHRVLLQLYRHESQPLFRESARLVMQLHDELVFEVRRERIVDVARLVVSLMVSDSATTAVPAAAPAVGAASVRQHLRLRVPLSVRSKVGVAWGSLVSWKVDEPLPRFADA